MSPSNQHLGQTLHKWGRAWVPRSSILTTDSPQRREQSTESSISAYHIYTMAYLLHSFISILFSQGLRSQSTFPSESESLYPPRQDKSYFKASRLLCSHISLWWVLTYFSMMCAHIYPRFLYSCYLSYIVGSSHFSCDQPACYTARLCMNIRK